MDAIPGISAILSDLLTKCGAVAALSVVLALYFIVQSAKIRSLWETDRSEAAKRLDAANATIIKLMETASKADTDVAVALESIKTLLLAFRVHGGDDN